MSHICICIMTVKLTLAESGIHYPTHEFRLTSLLQQCQNSSISPPAECSREPVQQQRQVGCHCMTAYTGTLQL